MTTRICSTFVIWLTITAVAAAQEAQELAGEWVLEIETGAETQQVPFTVDVTEAGLISATVEDDDDEETPELGIQILTFESGELEFTIGTDTGYPVKFSGTYHGDTIEGSLETGMGEIKGQVFRVDSMPREGESEGESVQTGYSFLVQGESEADYAYHSYLLFGREPLTERLERKYLSLIRACLDVGSVELIPESVELVNALHIPVVASPATPLTAETVLAVYDFARAKQLIRLIREYPHFTGQCVVTFKEALSGQTAPISYFRFQTMSHVPAHICGSWIGLIVHRASFGDHYDDAGFFDSTGREWVQEVWTALNTASPFYTVAIEHVGTWIKWPFD